MLTQSIMKRALRLMEGWETVPRVTSPWHERPSRKQTSVASVCVLLPRRYEDPPFDWRANWRSMVSLSPSAGSWSSFP